MLQLNFQTVLMKLYCFLRTIVALGYFGWVYDTYAKHSCRLDYQFRQSLSASFKTLLAMLPPKVHSVYYRDDIGNISSSHLRINSQKVLIFIMHSLEPNANTSCSKDWLCTVMNTNPHAWFPFLEISGSVSVPITWQ